MHDFKKNNFTIIHIVAALMVLVGHQFVLMGQSQLIFFGMDMHGLGVRILFMVSGYLVSASYFRSKNPAEYIWKRLSRLYPPLIVCLCITIIVLRFFSDTPETYWKSAIEYFLYNLEMRPKFNLDGVFMNNPYPIGVNGSLWTLPIEIACYFLLIPFLEIFRLLKKKSLVLASIFSGAMLLCLSCFDRWRVTDGSNISFVFWDTDWLNLSSLGLFFLIGVNAQILELKKICDIQIGVLVVVIHACLPYNMKYMLSPYVISYIVLSFGLIQQPLFHKYVKKDICYGLYLYAFPIQQMIIDIIIVKHSIQLSPYLMCLISIIIVMTIAMIEYHFIEERDWFKKKMI